MRSFARHFTKIVLLCSLAIHNFSLAQISQIQLDAVLIESSDLMQSGDTQAALAVLKRYEETFSTQPEYLNNLAVAYLGNSQPREALTILRQLVDSDPIFSIVSHNLLELELQIAEGPPEKLNPILFVQSTRSFFESELGEIEEIAGITGTPANQPASEPTLAPTITPTRVEPIQTAVQIPEADANSYSETDRSTLRNLTTAWAQSWSEGDVEPYLNFYADDYQPDENTSHLQWRGNRDAALTRSGDISVNLTDIVVQLVENRAIVVSQQQYQSSNYSDRVQKTLVYSYLNERWKIISETSTDLD